MVIHRIMLSLSFFVTLGDSSNPDHWSFDRKILLHVEAKSQKLISVKCVHFNLPEMHKIADFHSNNLGIGE